MRLNWFLMNRQIRCAHRTAHSYRPAQIQFYGPKRWPLWDTAESMEHRRLDEKYGWYYTGD